MIKAPIFPGAIKLRNVLDCQGKILEAVMDTTHVGVRRHNIHNIQIVLATQWFFWVISLALPRGSKRLTMDRSAEADARAPAAVFLKYAVIFVWFVVDVGRNLSVSTFR